MQKTKRRPRAAGLAARSRARRGAATARVYLTSFQYAAFRRQVITVNRPRNSSTQTPMRTRVALRRLAHPLQVGHQVADGLVVLRLRQRAGRDLLEAARNDASSWSGRADPSPRRTRRAARPAAPTARAASRRRGRRGCSSRSAWCRRGRRCAGRCTGSRRRCPCRCSARERAITDRSGGAAPNQSLACFGSSVDLHRVADLVGGEQQVLLDLRRRSGRCRCRRL